MGLGTLATNTFQFVKQLATISPNNRLVGSMTNPYEEAFYAIKPENHWKHAGAYRGLAYTLANKIARPFANAPTKLFIAKNVNKPLENKTRPISKETLAYLSKNSAYSPYVTKAVEIVEVVDHPFLELMENINPYSNAFDFMELMSINMDIMGNAYWYVVKNAMGTPVELWSIPPQWMYVVADKEKFIKGYLFHKPGNLTGEGVPFETDEIIHFKYPSINNIYYGVSPLGAVSDSYNLQVNIDRYDIAFFSNMTRPDGVLTSEGTVSDTVFEKIKKQFKQRNSGVNKARSIIVLEGNVKWQQTSHAPTEIGLKDANRDVMEKMAAAFDVPLSKLITENVNKSNAEAGQTDLLRDGVEPRLTRRDQKINEQLMPMFGPGLFIAHANTVPEDKEFRLKERNENIKGGSSTVNEERAKDGEEPVEGGDILYQPAGVAGPAGGVMEPTEPVKDENLKHSKQVKFIFRDKGCRRPIEMSQVETREYKLTTKEDRDEYYKVFEATLDPLEDEFIKALHKYFKAQEKQVLANLRKVKGRDYQQRTRRDRIKATSGDIDSILFAKSEAEAKYVAEVGPQYPVVMLAAGAVAAQQVIDSGATVTVTPTIGVPTGEFEFDLATPEVRRWIGERLKWVADDISDTTIKKITQTLQRGIEAGESIPDLAKRIESVYADAIGSRSVMIARTETISAYSEASTQAYIQSGVVSKVVWIATRDGRVRDDHLGLDGVETDLANGQTNWTFADGVTTRGPGLSGVAHQDINCRCATAPVIEI